MIDTYVCKGNIYQYPSVSEVIRGNTDINNMVLERFKQLGYNLENPLENYILEGNTVLIKPNLVMDKNGIVENGTDCLYANASIVAALMPYIIKALNKNGKIIIADAPMQSCDFEKLINSSGYQEIVDYYQTDDVDISLVDLRGLKSIYKNGSLIQKINENDSLVVDLGNQSMHAVLDEKLIQKERITNYDPNELAKHHTKDKHEYSVSRLVLEADCIINIPKPKSHRKNGVTIGMKNFVGISTRKEYLPHHRVGDIASGGDEYKKKSYLLKLRSCCMDKYNNHMANKRYNIAKIYKLLGIVLYKIAGIFIRNNYEEGSWYGNDTIWRTIVDLNKIVNYCDKKGNMTNVKQRNILYIADMIIIGEKEGPLLPTPKRAGMIVMSSNVYNFDLIIATIMGFDVNKINLYKNIIKSENINLSKVLIHSNNKEIDGKVLNEIVYDDTLQVEPSNGHKGYIELRK